MSTTVTSCIILGAGKPFKGINPSALQESSDQWKVLDWVLSSISTLQPEMYFVSGYKAQEVSEQYPDFNYINNPEWEKTSAAYSYLLAELEANSEQIVTYADILFHRYAIEQLGDSQADITIAYDSKWKNRYHGRTDEDLSRCEKIIFSGNQILRLGPDIEVDLANGEFVGLVKFSPKVLAYIQKDKQRHLERLRLAKMSELVEILRTAGFEVSGIDLQGDWAELNEPQDLAHFILGTKAQTLNRLSNIVTKSIIEDQVSFTVNKWQNFSSNIISEIQENFNQINVAVRSSALSEDGFNTANAGAYTSILDIDTSKSDILSNAIDEVIASYPDGNENNQVLVQPMVNNVQASGVAFTRTLAHGAPYYVINYDDTTGSTESITSGQGKEHKTLFINKNIEIHTTDLPEIMVNLLFAIQEIEQLLHFDSLDIEFAISDNSIHILQVRPIAVDHQTENIEDDNISNQLSIAKQHFRNLQKPRPFVFGNKAIFGIMPDWNPAEIIGTNPGRLASSLYRYLIMDNIWATQRAEYGYKDVRPQPLLTMFAGHPYVDIRASFNSFLPSNLDESLSEKLINFYLQWLTDHPFLHDKVEFDVVPTCYSLDFIHWRERLEKHGGFSIKELYALEDGLKELTFGALNRNKSDSSSIKILEDRFTLIMQQNLEPLDRMASLLDDCKTYGTLPFSHLARSAFIAVTLLKSGVNNNILSQKAVDAFMNSIRTVTHSFTKDAQETAKGTLKWEEFVNRYGHLRPGTYDITSPSYQEDPEHYLKPIVDKAMDSTEHRGHDIDLWLKERRGFADTLNQHGFNVTEDSLDDFFRSAIEGREYAKFAFTRNLSVALNSLLEFGSSVGLQRDQLANIPLDIFYSIQSGEVVPHLSSWLSSIADEGESFRKLASLIELPPLLINEQDFDYFYYPSTQANFVGSSRIMASCIDLSSNHNDVDELQLAGKIILIPQADPGFDWLFGQNIGGLITMYGGANSHMAIRSAEFGLPAAIGVGETEYQRLCSATTLELDVSNRSIRIV